MAEQIKYVSLDNLTKYDEKIKSHIQTKDDVLKTNLEEQVTLVANAVDAEATRAKAAEATNAAAAQAAQKTADDITAYVGTFTASDGVDTVVKYIDKKTANIASDETVSAIESRVTQAEKDIDAVEGRTTTLETAVADRYTKGEIDAKVDTLTQANTTTQGAVDAIEADYLKSADKTELTNAITAEATTARAAEKANADAIAAIEADYLVEADKTALQEAIDGVAEDVATINGDYLKKADKTELEGKINAKADQTAFDEEVQRATQAEAGLQTQINTIMSNPDAEGAINSINEFTQYVADHGTIADGFRTDINKNKDDIAAMDTAYKAADTAMQGRLNALEAIDHEAYVAADTALKNELTTEIGKKANQTAFESAVQTLEGVDAGLGNRITTLENKFGTGEGSVDDMVSDAIDAEAARVDGELAKKVDKVDGYGLSKNDLSDALKANYDAAYTHSQEAHAPANAQANVIESVKVNGTVLTITGKAVDISVPTNNAQLTNGAGYLVANDIANKADKGTTLASYGISDAYTSAQTDTAIANAMAQIQSCTDAEINALFA